MTRDNTYWRHRAAQRMFEHMQSAEEISDQIAKLYLKASRYLSVEMQGIFEKYMTKHKLTEKEALRLINTLHDKTSLNELRQKLQAAGDRDEKARLITELEAPAYQARIERFQQLQNQIDLVMHQIYQQEKQFSTKHYFDLANEAYYRSMFDIQQQAGLGFSFSHVDPKQIDRVVDSKWSGKNYSSRIWGNTRALAQDLKEELLINLVTGRTEREVAQILANKFAKGASAARRLVRTESCYLSNQMEMESYKECGIDTYIYVATLDLRTCDDCCAPLDGRRFPVAEQQPGKNCPPMHPWCRCTTIAFASESSFARMKRRAWNPEKKKTELVPASMNYQEWYKKYVKGNAENKETEKEVDKLSESDILKSESTKEAAGVHTIGKIDREIYRCITDDIMTDDVIITDNQIQHIKDRHPDSYQKSIDNLKRALENPDFIIEDKHKNTGLVVKGLDAEEGHTQIVLRVCTSEDPVEYKNSIISSWEISNKRLQNYLRNKRILYKKE